MSNKISTHLPIFDDPPADDESSCSPKIYVSNEEKMILDNMRKFRDRAIELRSRLKETESDDERSRHREQSSPSCERDAPTSPSAANRPTSAR